MRGLCLLPLMLVLTFAACGEAETEAQLGGSVATLGYSLAYDATRMRLVGGQLAIQYLDGRQIPVQVFVDVDSAELSGPMTVALPDHGNVVGDRANDTLPELVRGQITLDAYTPSDGAPIAGRFDATVERNGREYTVYGSFRGELEVL